MTTQKIKDLKDPEKGDVVFYKDLMENHNNRMLRSKAYYEAMYKYSVESLMQNEGYLDELRHEMHELKVPLEE